MTAYYPVLLALANRPALVIGGGPTAALKVAGLRAADARVTVVAPALTPELAEAAAAGDISHLARCWQETDLDGAWALVMMADEDRTDNAAVARAARARGLLVNCADDPEHCDFILPAIHRAGPITLAVSTGGASPALAGWLRDLLASTLTDDVLALADLLADVRADLRAQGRLAPATAWKSAIDDELRALLARRDLPAARQRLLTALDAA